MTRAVRLIRSERLCDVVDYSGVLVAATPRPPADQVFFMARVEWHSGEDDSSASNPAASGR